MNFKTPQYEHQAKAFEKFKDAEYFGLFMDMGTGKSKTAIDIASYRFTNKSINAVLIIAPNGVHSQWIHDQIPLHCSVPFTCFTWDAGRKGRRYYDNRLTEFLSGDTPDKLKFFAINVEAFQTESPLHYIANYVKTHQTFIIIDESTRIKSPSAKRSKIIHRLAKYGIRCILTGTPVAQRPFDLWSQFEFLKTNFWQCNYFMFQHRYGILCRQVSPRSGKRYNTLIDEGTYAKIASAIKKRCEMYHTDNLDAYSISELAVIFGVSEKVIIHIMTHPEYHKYKDLDKLKKIIEPFVFAVKKEDCLDLPEKVYQSMIIEMPKEIRQLYNQLKTELLAEYQGKELTITNKVVLTLRLMQVAGGFFPTLYEDSYDEHELPNGETIRFKRQRLVSINAKDTKLDALISDIEETDENEQIIVWANFVAELEAIHAKLSEHYPTCLYYGKTDSALRRKIVEDFRNARYRIFVGNPATAGFGLNLQNATLQYYYSNSFRVENRLQSEDRSHRIGVKRVCVYKDLIYRNSIDEKIYQHLVNGKDMNDYFKSVSLEELVEDKSDGDEEA